MKKLRLVAFNKNIVSNMNYIFVPNFACLYMKKYIIYIELLIVVVMKAK